MKKTSRRAPPKATASHKATSHPRQSAPQTANGTVKRHPDGFGFFIPEDPATPDVYIPRHSMEGIMTNDKVTVSIEKERGGDRYRGEIIKILSRGHKTIVGRLNAFPQGGGSIKDEGKGWGFDLVIKKDNTLNAKDGELVAVEITKYPDQGEFTGKVTQVLGDIADPMTDIQRVLLNQNIPQVWPEAVKKEASAISETVSDADRKGRKDLRGLNLITIDGATAKDYDDAIFVDLKNDGFQLYVAIADVSHYVRPGTAIDTEAYERGTSVYFPNFVVPMLPEILSNGLCSLNPMVDRLALVAKMNIDFQGNITSSDFFEAVIKSQARVTYGEAQEIIEGRTIDKFKHVAADIKRAADLAKLLMARRFRDGSLELEIPEIQLIIDASGTPVDISKGERLFAHRLIEEMMLAANIAVGEHLSKREIPALFRVHEPPNPLAIETLERFMKHFGSHTKLTDGKLQKRLTKALEEFHGKPEAQILNILTLRSMSQAKYSPQNVGHFGLGFEHYTHFTSPIRRYPDLIVHRLLKHTIGVKGYKLMTDDDVATAGQMLSACEQRAAKSERQIQAIKKARFMEKHVGQEFDGMISSVTKFGFFVLLREFEVDGLVPLDKLGQGSRERYEFDPENLKLVAPRSGHTFEIGQSVRVRVADANIEAGQVDFDLAENPATARKSQSRSAGKAQDRHQDRKGRRQEAPAPHQDQPQGKRTRSRSAKHEQSRSVNAGNLPKTADRLTERVGKRGGKRGDDRPHNNKHVRHESARPEPQRNFSAKSKHTSQRAERPAPVKFNAKEADVLDLDKVEKTETTFMERNVFDPARKILEALQRRGLKPSGAMDSGMSRQELIKSKDKPDRRGANGRNGGRREDDRREADRDERSGGAKGKQLRDREMKRGSSQKRSAGAGAPADAGRPNRGAAGEARGGKKSGGRGGSSRRGRRG